MLPMENAAQMNAYIHARSTQTKCIGGEHPRATQSNETNRPCAICPNENVGANIHAQFSQAKCVGAVPVCPPERPRSGVSMPKIHALCAGNERWMRPCGATRAGTQAPPLPISIKPRGVSLPHRGYTFDSAGLASATQPTLGNDVSEEATPLGVVLFPSHCFLMSSPYSTRGRKCIAHSRPHS